MDDEEMIVIVRAISESGEVLYTQRTYTDYSSADPDRLDALDLPEEIRYPELEHINVINEEREDLAGEVGAIQEFFVLASAPSIIAFAGLVKAFLLRDKKREVHLYWPGGKPRLIVKGDLSVDEIARLLRESSLKNSTDDSPGPGTTSE